MKKKYKDDFFQNRSEKIEKGINRIEKIISGLGLVLDHEKSVRKEFDLFKILDQIILDFSETISDTKIDFKCEIPTGMSYILSGDEGVVYHSFLNLFKNAFHAVEHETDPKISFVVEIIDNEVVLKIRDNGCGISDDDRDKIFDPFYTTKEIHHGTGIGLYVVFNMVKDFSGKITVDSRKDEFTEFTIILPGMINVLNNIKPLSVK